MGVRYRLIMTTKTDKTKWITRDYGSFVGKTIKQIRPLTKSECEDNCWDYDHEDYAVVVIFTDNTAFLPLSDPEGNGAGFLMAWFWRPSERS